MSPTLERRVEAAQDVTVAVACAMRTKNSGVQDRRARSARYPERANVVCFDLACAWLIKGLLSIYLIPDP